MARKMSKYQESAIAVRPFITPFLEAKGYINNEELKALITKHTGRKIKTETGLSRVQNWLTEV